MASNPPFQVEDQTDDDFFDKLVEEDFVEPTELRPKHVEGSDSDDIKAFADLGINEVGNGIEDSGEETGIKFEGEKECDNIDGGIVKNVDCGITKNVDGGIIESVDGGVSNVQTEGRSQSFSSNSIDCDNNVTESSNDIIRSESTSDSLLSKSNGSGDSGVKEVGWSSFQNGGDGYGSYSDFFNDYVDNSNAEVKSVSGTDELKTNDMNNSIDYGQYQKDQVYGASVDQSSNGQDLGNSKYWENLYPGWKFDQITGQWYQVEDSNALANVQGSFNTNSAVSDGTKEVSYMQQNAQSILGTVPETSTIESVSNWNQTSQENNGYPEHMILDPQYPGWYYDTIAQEWRSLELYNASIQSTTQAYDQQNQNVSALGGNYAQSTNSFYSGYGQANNYSSQDVDGQVHGVGWAGSYDNNNQHGLNNLQTANVPTYGGNQEFDSSYGSKVSVGKNQQKPFNSFGAVPIYNQPGQANVKRNEQMSLSNDYYSSGNTLINQSFNSGRQSSYGTDIEKSSAGRPPHVLVTFGFGGKLIVMKDTSSLRSLPYGSEDHVGGSVSVLNLMEVIMGNTDYSSIGMFDYFGALCQQSFPGPLVGGSVGSKELTKWVNERIANCESPGMAYKKGEVLGLLLNLLKIAFQHYGKLRSPFGSDTTLLENDVPESEVAKLFASSKSNSALYASLGHCLQNVPSEGQIRATASEVQNLLVSGRKKEALQRAQEGQLWGPALVLALQLGDQYYIDVVKQMALRHLVAGSPLRTLCLLIAGQPREVFSTDSTTDTNFLGAPNMYQNPAQPAANSMLDGWEENLAVITANRTKDDELVIIHLGDCLWKERSEIIAAHICYLVAEANFESYSDSARLCLLGADHWKFPRTYASPEAIQRTELYEYSKVLGNSQFVLLPFQPYKLIYAYMLAEVGKVADSLKYCQALIKSLKTGRAPEVDTWKQLVLSLEERIRTHQQGGYSANLVPAKLVGKLLYFFDSTAHRVVGGLPPPAPSTSHGSAQNEGPRVSTSQSTMAMSSLVPSDSLEPISEWMADGNRKTMPNRSASEPDFGRSPRQGKASDSAGASRFSRFGFGSQLLQKTVGLVMRPRSDRQAKLGEKNKFYYDEKLKRWVEEGADPPAEEAAPPPRPTTSAFKSGMSDYNLKSAMKKEGSPTNGSPEFKSPTPTENNSGIPPIAPSSNQFSARGRTSVRSRYVDTFNQGGTGSSPNLFHSPSVPSVKPAATPNTKFFIPSPVLSSEHMESIAENSQECTTINEQASTSSMNGSFPSPTPSFMPVQRFPSLENIPSNVLFPNDNKSNPSHARRASWSGGSCTTTAFTACNNTPEVKPIIETFGRSPSSSSITSEPYLMNVPTDRGGFVDDLHELQL